MSEAIIEARGLRRSYEDAGRTVEVLRGIDLSIGAGDRIAIVGSSGSGKSTLLNLLSGLDDPSVGSVTIAGQALAGLSQNRRAALRNRYLGFVYQFHHLLAEFTALENVAMPLLIRRLSPAEARLRAAAMLERVGLGKRMQHKPAELSGGERQRVAIARALVGEPGVVLMDEPTGNLDSQTAAEVQALMAELNATLNTAFVVVTHDMVLARSLSRVLRLVDGQLRSED